MWPVVFTLQYLLFVDNPSTLDSRYRTTIYQYRGVYYNKIIKRGSIQYDNIEGSLQYNNIKEGHYNIMI